MFLAPILGLLLGIVSLPTAPTAHATDRAGVIAADRLAKLDAKLVAYEKQTSNQVLVYIDNEVPDGGDIDEFTRAAANEWGVGDKAKNNGVAFFLFIKSRQMQMEVGQGIDLTQEQADEILSHATAQLKAKDYAGAIDRITDEVIAATRKH